MFLEDWPKTHPDRPAIIMGQGTVVTYRQLDERATRAQQLLRSYGLVPGDTIAIFSDNSPRYHELTWAARRSGLYFAAVNSHLNAEELAYILADSSARVLFASAALSEVAQAMTAQVAPNVERRLAIGGPISGFDDYDAAVSGMAADPIVSMQEGELLQYSSGTTGRPKGIRRAPHDVPWTLDDDIVVKFLRAIDLTDGATYLSPAPLYHSAPISFSMGVHRLGGTVVIMERFDPREALRLIETLRITHGQFVPTMFVRMLKLPAAERESYDVSSLVRVLHAAAPCPIDVKRAMIDWWGPIVSEYWASSESAGTSFITAAEWLEHPGSVGRTFVGTLHICDEAGNELPVGEIGQVWAEGSRDFVYLNDPAKTAEAHNDRGWTSVGDVGRLDADGYLYLTDRKAFMIISGGVNIYPQEAENLLASHPKVMDAAVFGVPDEDMGEAVHGVVQPIDWQDAGPELAAELISYCRGRLARYKCPRQIDFAKTLPRLDTGKLYKKKLQASYREAYEKARSDAR